MNSKIKILFFFISLLAATSCIRQTKPETQNSDVANGTDTLEWLKKDEFGNISLNQSYFENDSSDMYIQVANIFEMVQKRDGNAQNLLPELRTYLKKHPDDGDAMLVVGMSLLKLNKDSGLFYCERGLALKPKKWDNLLLLAKNYDAMDLNEKAIAAIKNAIQLNPNKASLKFERGIITMHNSDAVNAWKDLKVIPNGLRNPYLSYFNRGLCNFALKKYTTCIKDCDTALSINPKYGDTFYLRACAKSNIKDYQGAFDDTKKAVEYGNKNAIPDLKKWEEYFTTMEKNKNGKQPR